MISSRLQRRLRHGLTLMELLVVVAILVILAGFIVPLGAHYIASSRTTATKANLVLIRDAIMGTQDKPGFYSDTGQMPTSIKDLFINPFPSTNPLSTFNRDTNLGWRGPYIISSGGSYTVNLAKNLTAFANGGYGTTGDPAVLDPWGNPIVLQIPNQTSYPTPTTAAAADLQFARLVSAGPNGVIDTPQNAIDTTNGLNNPYPLAASRGDDIVLFINHSDSDP